MFTKETGTLSDSGVYTNSVQENPSRVSIYGINRCEDQVIGFEFISRQYINNPTCCGTNIPHLCIPIEIVTPIVLETVEFWATDDPCYKDWTVKKIEEPSVEIQRDSEDNATGILVRFFKNESCCYPPQMAFKLLSIDSTGCKYTLSHGLLIFR